MPLFDVFRTRRHTEPLVKLPPAGEPIAFDEEELQAIRSSWPDGFIDRGESIVTHLGVAIEGPRAASFRRGLVADSLARLAGRRLRRKEPQAAASTCIKAIALWHDDFDAWLVLSAVYTVARDPSRAERLLEEAKRAARRRGIRTDSPFWLSKIEGVERIVDPQRGL